MTIDFTFSAMEHPSSDITVIELAKKLEEEHQIIENFWDNIFEEFGKELFLGIKHTHKIDERNLESWIKDRWYRYGAHEQKFGFSQKAINEGRPPFIDTSTYMLSMMPEITLEGKENGSFKIKQKR